MTTNSFSSFFGDRAVLVDPASQPGLHIWCKKCHGGIIKPNAFGWVKIQIAIMQCPTIGYIW